MKVINDSKFCDEASVTKQHVEDVSIPVKNVFGSIVQMTRRIHPENAGKQKGLYLCLYILWLCPIF